jgi:hypothetical protein
MNDGEFKKRIEEHKHGLAEIIGKPQTEILTEVASLLENEGILVELMLDDARNEWLEIEECELPIKTNGTVDWQKTAELMELRNIIRNRWFEKWFGK